ncbi:hypothetical protein OSTOST_15365 [Ostertagia ostertagi]
MSANGHTDRSDEIIAGIIMFTKIQASSNYIQVSVVGSVLNVSAVVLIYRTPWFHNAFGFICASHLLADVGVLVIFMFWAAPAALLGYAEAITESYFGERMGQLTMVFWYAAIYGQLQIALNRLIAILSPMLYKFVY